MKCSHFFKRLLSTIVIAVVFKVAAWAQPSLIFDKAAPDAGEQFCIEVAVKDFTDILSMQFSINWDPTVIQFDGVQGFGLPNLTAANFDPTLAAEGKLGVNWVFGTCSPSATGFTILEDGTRIFELCFTALGAYGETSPISLSSDPTTINVQRVNACPNNIGMLSTNGFVSVGVRPLTLIASQETANEGDLVCVDYMVTGFDDMSSMQFSVNWDPSIIKFENVVVLENLVNLAASSFGTPALPTVEDGNLILSWSIPGNMGVSLPDSTVLFQVCYRVVGECEKTSSITFSDSPRPFEFTNEVVTGFRLTVQTVPGSVRVGACNPTGLQLFADCGAPVNPNEEVCVKVSTAGFNQIKEFNWNLEWNENVLEFVRIQSINTGLSGFDINDFNRANVSNGVLGVNWMTVLPSGISLPGGQGDLFEVCFKVVGVGGGSPVQFDGSPPRVINATNNNIGINPSNCAVEVIKPNGVIMTLSDAEAPLGDETCVAVSVSNFTDIETYQFSMAWQPNHASFVGINNIDLPEASLANFGLLGVESGGFTFVWEPSQAYSVADNTVIFEACFQMVGDPQDCQMLSVVNEPRVTEATSTVSNGNDIGVTSQDAELCVLFPDGYLLDIGEVSADTGSVACVPIMVTSFDDILSTQFAISWEPSALQYNGVQNPGTLMGLNDASFDITSTDVGLLQVNWSSAQSVTLPDSSVIFELCFDLVGIPDSCYGLRVGDPDPLVTTLNGDGSVLSEPGEVCIRNRLIVIDTVITPVSCPGTNDGSIILRVGGGREPLGYTWETIPATTPRFGPEARNLPPGLVTVTVFDNSNPALIYRDTFEVTLAGELPIAVAGDDKPFVCDPPIVPLNGAGSSTGATFSYLWTTASGRLTPDFDRINSGALAPGNYILAVTNNETGCIARDTVQITPNDVPFADAGFDSDFICETEFVTLDGSASTSGPAISYLWTSRNGGVIPEGQETLINPNVTAPGTYVLAVSNTQTSCVSRDTVVVAPNQDFPIADAGTDVNLGCDDGSFVRLVASGDNAGLNIFNEWLRPNGQVYASSDTTTVDTIGTFILRVVNTDNNCATLDTVQVLPSLDAPLVDAGDFSEITCVADTVTLNASIGNSSNFVFEWSAQEGGAFVDGTETNLTPNVAMPGIYQLLVRDTVTNCTVADTVSVAINQQQPTVEAGEVADNITCDNNMVMLDGTGTSTGDDFSYNWTLNTQTIASDTLQVAINTPGTYYLEVTNMRNGCMAMDSVVVRASTDIPQITLPIEEQELTCNVNSLMIDAQVTAANGFSFEWIILEGGNIVSGETTLSIEVDAPGTYQLKVVDDVTGCEGVNEAIVVPDASSPTASISLDSVDLTCITEVVTLNGDGSSVGTDFTYLWNALDGGTPPSPNNALQTSANATGRYELVVTDVSNGCVSTDTIVVLEDRTPPSISFATPDQLSCNISTVMLDASGSGPADNLSGVWTGLRGAPNPTGTGLMVEVTQGGTYQLELTNNANGCVATDTIVVMVDENRPQAIIDQPNALSCTEPSVMLNATNSSVNGDFTTTWATVSGSGTVQPDAANPLMATATGAGVYELTITRSADGCESIAQVTLNEPEVPMASATADQSVIGCGEMTMINSAGSSVGDSIAYQWSVLEGTGTIANPTAASIQASQAGTYQLMVTNTNNGCTDIASVSITFDVQFELANAGADMAACEPSANLTANLPAGTTGRWTSMSGATIDNPTAAAINISNLTVGDNTFMWTLSADGCQDYSSDQVVVKLESAPIAADDALTLKAGETTGSILVSGNDVTANVLEFNVTISETPMFGSASVTTGGRVAYNVKPGVFGQDEFSYLICSTNCPTLCDSAFVQIFIEEDPNFEAPPRTNAITPNGDGLNEQLVFDELLVNPEQYPDNELIIFNRWGDIIYQARPYNNTWDGTNDTGNNLPEGTYYYILRLNISEGIIIRGDVTIVR